MEVLDSPTRLEFNNGKLFPVNFLILGYVFLGLSMILIITGGFIFGSILLLVSLFICFTWQKVKIDPEKKQIYEYTSIFGEIDIGKPYSFEGYQLITTMPLIESIRIYARVTNSTTVSDSYFAIAVFKDRLKGKKIITKYDSRNEAEAVAKELAQRLGFNYFDYDPKLVRDIMLGNKTL